MKVDVRGFDLAAFKAISDGKYNLGSVILGQNGLSKVNNHHTFTSRNGRVNTADENRAVREKLYEAIRGGQGDRPLDETCLTAIRTKLGLDATGHVTENNGVGTMELTRRDIKQILAFAEQGQTSANIFKTARENVKAMITATGLSLKDQTVLEMNLLGENGKLANWQRVFDGRIVNSLTHIDPATAATANAIGNPAAQLAEQIRQTSQSFINSFVTFVNTARAAITAKTDEIRNAINEKIDASELNQLALKEDERQATDALFARLRNAPAELAKQFEGHLLVRLGNLNFAEFPNASAEQVAESFMNGLFGLQANLLARADRHLALQTQGVNTRIRNEALEAQRAVNAGREAIEAKMSELDERFEAFDAHLAFLEKTFAGLAEGHPRADERLDGDTVNRGFGDLKAAIEAVRREKAAFTEKVSQKVAALKADTVEANRQEVAEGCERILAQAQTAINEKIDALNGKLKLTVVPKYGEDPSVAAEATKAKRAALTEKLETEWKAESDKFADFLDKFVSANKEDLIELNDEERRKFNGILDDIKARFGETNRKAFVENHGIGDAKPDDLFTKAKEDALKVVDNARTLNFTKMHGRLQAKFEILNKWLAGKDDNFATHFKELTGCTFSSLVTNDANRAEGLKRMTLTLVRRLEKMIRQEAEDVREAMKPGRPVYTVLAKTKKELETNMIAMLGELALPDRLKRAGDEPEIRTTLLKGFDASVANVLKELKIPAESKLGQRLLSDGARMRKGLELHILNEYVYVGKPASEFKNLPSNLLQSFRSLAEARKLREEILSDLQDNKLAPLSDKLYYGGSGVPDEKLMAQSKTLQTLMAAIQQDDANVGMKDTLTLEALKGMAKKGVFSGVSQENVAKGLAEGKREISPAEDAMRLARDLTFDSPIGKMPEAPAFDAGLDGRLVNPQGPREDPRPVPAFDNVIHAN